MAHYNLSNKAIADLSDIWNYTCKTWSERQADNYYFMLPDMCKKLAAKPIIGKKYDNVYTGLLGLYKQRHIIFYTAGKEKIEIVRILHSRMDIKTRLNG